MTTALERESAETLATNSDSGDVTCSGQTATADCPYCNGPETD